MPTKIDTIGKKVAEIDLVSLFQPADGEITQRYGRIGSGKTYGATVDVLEELSHGHVVYVNWKMDYHGFDQRRSLVHVLGTILFPWKNTLYDFPAENLRYIAVDEDFIDNFEKLTDCSVYLDEGHVVFDSYEMAKMSMQKRVAVLHTRHFDRSINIISQRPTAVHRMLRANVNRFYKYECLIKTSLFNIPIVLFRRTEYQDMVEENVDESQPLSYKLYFLNAKIAEAYDSKYLRGDIQPSQKVMFSAFTFSLLDRFRLFFMVLFNRR